MPGLLLRDSLLVLVTAAVGASIYALQSQAGQQRTTSALLDVLDGVCIQLNGLEWQAVARREVTPTLRNDIDSTLKQHSELLSHLQRRVVEVPALKMLIADERRFAEAIEREVAAIDRGQWQVAMRLDATETVPLYSRIDDRVGNITRAQNRAIKLAEQRANWGSAGVLLLGALLVGVLLWRNFQSLRKHHSSHDRLQSEQQRTQHLTRLLENSKEALLVVDVQGRVKFASGAAVRIAGVEPEMLAGTKIVGYCHPDDHDYARQWLKRSLREPELVHEGRFRVVSRMHGWRQFEVSITNLLNDPTVGGLLLHAQDITRRLQAEEKLQELAYRDPLTGLPNRSFLNDQLEQRANDVGQTGRFALLFMDLDNFKHVNDSLGHHAGDELLAAVGKRLASAIRSGDVLARWGGDEFVLLIEQADDETQVIEFAERLLENMNRPFLMPGHDVLIGLSIGIALSRDDGSSLVSELLRQADHALYQSKLNRKGSYRVFRGSGVPSASPRLLLEADMHHAIERGELRVHYQPIFWLPTDSFVDAEALVRWEHPERGMIPPDEFIPLAEDSALIEHLGRAVFEQVLADLARWRRRGCLSPAFRMHVNVSPRELRAPRFPEIIAALLAKHDIPAEMLRLEITERSLLDPGSEDARWFAALTALGLQFCLDDFGTGYSSLSSLHQYPLSALKVDRSFIRRLDTDVSAPTVLAAIYSVAEAFSLEVVAEGIETASQRELLVALGYTLGQGYFYAQALPALEFERKYLEDQGVALQLLNTG